MSEAKVYPVAASPKREPHLDAAGYERMYRASIDDPAGFWSQQARELLTWYGEDWRQVYDADMTQGRVRWFEGGTLNACYNCLDRHLETRGNQTAIIWEGDDPDRHIYITYREAHAEVSRLANVLKAQGVGKGDRVCLYMPMIPEAAYAMLACARIGAIHSVVFGGFSPHALRDRILDAGCRVVITADEGLRGARTIPLKHNTDAALADCPDVHTVITVQRTGGDVPWVDGRDIWYHDTVPGASTDCPCEVMDAEDPLFILYTSGSTGKPKGVQHATAGYLLQVAITHKYVFDYHDDEVYWCTADVGWITGHSYILYGPMANGATTLIFEGIPTYPDAGRHWQICDKHGVSIYYTAPTGLRQLMRQGNEFVQHTSRASLRVLGTVGEPINPEAWEWYYHVVGEGRCAIVDTWWQTETGGIMISPLPGAIDLKPGSATKPFFGVLPGIVDDDGHLIETSPARGNLVIRRPWPGQLRTVYGDHQRAVNTYYASFPGFYFSGDNAMRDEDGYYWVIGRVDDVINVSGHRIGTAEVESALVLHSEVAEAAVVGFPHEVKGEGIYAYVSLMAGADTSAAHLEPLRGELIDLVSQEIGRFAKPDAIQWAPSLPKTRSGKIMRRILRKVAASDLDNLGDTSTLADPSVVDDLVERREQA